MGSHKDIPDRRAMIARAKVWRSIEGACVTAMIHIGLKLGLYDALVQQAPISPAALAAQVGLQERWVEEWAYGSVSAGLLAMDDNGDVWVPREIEATLLNPQTGLPGFAWLVPRLIRGIDEVVEGFQTGQGATLDRLGEEAVRGIDVSGVWYEDHLLDDVLAHVDGICDRLDSGGRVVDVGCGGGGAVIALAKRFPRSRFLGIDLSSVAVDYARRSARSEGLTGTNFVCGSIESCADSLTGDVHLALTLDALHDFQDPLATARVLHTVLARGGAWVVMEPVSYGSAAQNIRDLQTPAISYALSVLAGLPSSCQSGGQPTGMLGLHEEAFSSLAVEAGFDYAGVIPSAGADSQFFISYRR